MIIKEKKNCTITILHSSELGLNSSPCLKKPQVISIDSIPAEVHSLMFNHGMSREEAEKTHKENLEWAM